MKKSSIIVCACLCLLVFAQTSFARRPAYSPTSIVYVTSDNATITMRATATAGSQQEALDNAEMNVIDVILFRGVPESKQKMALVGSNETNAMMENNPYFTEFYEGKRYKSFVVSAKPNGAFKKLKGRQFETTADVTINYVNLRRDLEQSGVIRKFGF